jgi:signal transduction histidine kinase
MSTLPVAPSTQVELLRRLAAAGTPREAAAEIVRLARTDPGCKAATIMWGPDATYEGPEPTPADRALARCASAPSMPVHSADNRRVALRLSEANSLVLLLSFDTRADADRFLAGAAAWLPLAGDNMGRALELDYLRASLASLERSERLQHALFAISDLAGSDRDMAEVLRGIHGIVGTLMYAENLFIVLHDAERDSLRFLYYVDTEDPPPPGDHLDMPMSSLERSLTWYLLRDARPLRGNTAQLATQISGPLAIVGPESFDWMGVPMLRGGRAQGAIVVQSYREEFGYTDEDRMLLEFVADHILTALERKQGKADLEHRVRLRTSELAEANQVLQQEIVERQRAERLHKALFQIARLATADISQAEFYGHVHSVVGELLNAENFYIALLAEEGAVLEFPYYADASQRVPGSRPLGRGLSEYVIRHRRTLRGLTQDIYDLAAQGEIELQMAGTPAVCWLGVPLLDGDEVLGLIVVQSYDAAVTYGEADQALLSFVATQVANSLQRRRYAESLRLANAQLEQRVQERTRELTNTLNELRDTQDELVRQEKLASLGGLVAGIAHEINTPLGICVTATTHVQGELRNWRKRLEAGTLDGNQVRAIFDELDTAMRILDNNTRRGAELVQSFKQIAVDQSSGKQRLFDLAEYLDEIVLSLKPKLKHSLAKVRVECPQDIRMNSFPGALSQVVTNLIMNSLQHGFEGRSHGTIAVAAALDGDEVLLDVVDDGVGMSAADLRRYFDPFFTTKRSSGGTGLGAHIVFNQVTSVLGGSIRAESRPGEGLQVHMRLPVDPVGSEPP